MSKAKFTKGEWYNCKQEDDMGKRFFVAESMLECGESRLICEIAENMTSDTDDALPSMAECKANYSLITAAPKMYALLEKLRHVVAIGGVADVIDYRETLNDIDSLLAKARGEL